MNKLDYKTLEDFIALYVIAPFYKKRLEKLQELELKTILKRKNPYLFKAKNIQTAGDFAKYVLDAHLSSQEETIFGNLLEKLAIHICEQVYGGYKAEENTFGSVDLIFDKENKTYIVGIKSAPYWGNADQKRKMVDNFKKARQILRENGNKNEIIAVNGCMYGKEGNFFKKNRTDDEKSYYKLCGQSFWRFISGIDELYQELILPIDKEAKERDDSFQNLYNKKINQMTKTLVEDFYSNDTFDWEKIVAFVSKEKSKPKI